MKRTGVFCLLLFVCLLFCTTLLPTAGAFDGFDGDFSRPGSSSTVTVGAEDVLSALGYSVTDTESDYLTSCVPVWLRYEDKISTETVTPHFVGGVLTVYVRPYTYLAANGESVTWIPTEVTVADRTEPCVLSEDAYIAVFSGVTEDLSLVATVRYETTFRIPKASVAALANLTYEEAVTVKENYDAAMRDYREEKTAYDTAARNYEAYLAALAEYREARLTYEAYLVAVAVYREELAAYEKYLSDLEEYERDAEAYWQYLVEMEEYNRRVAAYNAYLSELEEYTASLATYRDYLAAADTVKRQLSYMNLARSLNIYTCTIYGSLQGPTVKAVLENEEILTGKIVDADPYAIALAGDATERLKTILKDYFSLTTDEEKYNYYTQNYTEIVNNYVDLFRSLDSLYRVRNVRAILIKEGKAQKYVAFLAELYAVTGLLSDQPVKNFEGTGCFDETYRIQHWDSAYADRYLSPDEILAGSDCPSLDGAIGTPLTGGYPTPVDEPVAPTPVENPQGSKPADRYRPLPPTEKKNPTPPAAVAEPEMPEEVPAPGDAPTAPKLTATERSLYSALETGALARRDIPDEDGTLTFFSSAKKKIFGADSVTVVFLDGADGETLYRTTVDRGSAAVYNGPIPVKGEDEEGIYTFDGWMYPDGRTADLSSCDADAVVIPHFTVTPKHRVVFRTDGEDTVLTVLHGDGAVYSGSVPLKESTVSTVYTFDGWVLGDGTFADLSAILSDLVVYPHFSEAARTYSVTFMIDGRSVTRNLPYGAYPALPEEILPQRAGNYIRRFDGLSPSPVPVTEDAEYTAVFSLSPLFSLPDGEAADVTFEDGDLTVDAPENTTLSLTSLYAFFPDAESFRVRMKGATLTFSYAALSGIRAKTPDALTLSATENTVAFGFSENGENIPVSAVATLEFFTENFAKTCRLSCNCGEKAYLNFTTGDDFVRFEADAGVLYTYAAEYGINLISDDGISFSVPDGTFLPGESVSFSYRLVTGYELASLIVKGRDGTAVFIDGNAFVMPEGGVDIVAKTKPLTYRIVFRAGGVTVKESRVSYGALPTPPPDPVRAPDASYTYVFAGWSEEISPAYADAVYDAVYEEIPHPPKEENSFGGTLFRWFAKIFRAIIDFFSRLFGLSE